MYNHYVSSVGDNLKHIQLTTKYRYKVMNSERVKIGVKVSIEEVCEKHKIEIIILNVLGEHLHMIVDCPRTFSDAKLLQIIKGASSYLIFRICPDMRNRYPQGHFWTTGYFCCSVGAEFDRVFDYVKNQQMHD